MKGLRATGDASPRLARRASKGDVGLILDVDAAVRRVMDTDAGGGERVK
jgi:hypothetical protein